MSDIAIRVENLGKQYSIGGPQRRHKTFQDALLYSLAAPVRWMRGERQESETFWALKDVSFEIKKGDAVGIIGRNGAGKSTLLKILSRITKPTEGRVDLYGRVASLLEVGTGFHTELSGRDNIYLNGAILGMTRREIDRKFDEIVDFSGVEKFIDTPVKHYSSGMHVRLAFAVAAHLEPDILVVDEVLAVGDAEFQKKCLGKMEDVTHEGRTVLFVSHNMGVIESLCRESVLLRSGSIVGIGSSKDIINQYLTLGYQENTTPLRIRKDRYGTGRVRLADIRVDNQEIRDRSLNVEFDLENATGNPLKSILLSVVIRNQLGSEISNLVNHIVDKPIFLDANGGIVRLTVKNLNLVPGTYSINVFVSSDQQNTEIFDWVKNAAEFDVPDYDFYGVGYPPYIKGETIYMDYDYENIETSK